MDAKKLHSIHTFHKYLAEVLKKALKDPIFLNNEDSLDTQLESILQKTKVQNLNKESNYMPNSLLMDKTSPMA